MSEENPKENEKPWYQERGCLIALVVLAGLLWLMHVTYNPNAPDPYRDNPLSDPDLQDDRPSQSPF